MTALNLTFAASAPVTLTGDGNLTLTFPAPQAVALSAVGMQGPGGGSAGVTDGDKGGIIVSGSGAVWTVKSGSISDLMLGASAIALFAAASHTHTIANITGLQSALDGKAGTVHTHVAADVTDFAATTRSTVLTGYAAAGARTALAATDTILGAFGKLGKWVADLAAIAFSGSASDLTAGTLPAARFDDTAHGPRAGGALHAVATGAAAGFMAAADKTKLDAITGTNTGDQTITLTGMVTGSGTGSFAASLGSFTKAQLNTAVSDGDVLYVGDVTSNATHTGDATGSTALTLATVNSNVGSFGSATQVATFTVNAKGLTTAAGNTSIAIPASQVTDFSEAVDDRVAALVVAGTNMTITYNDAANTLTFDAAGGGGGGAPQILSWVI